MSGAHVHNFCGKDFEDLTNILNTLSYEKMIDYIEECIRARETDFEFHEKKNMIKNLENDLKNEIEVNNLSPSSPVVKSLKITIQHYKDTRKAHQTVIKILKERLTQIEKYYIKYGEKPVLIQDKLHKLFNAPHKSVAPSKQSSVATLLPAKQSSVATLLPAKQPSVAPSLPAKQFSLQPAKMQQPSKTQKQYAKIPQPISLASFIVPPSKSKSKKAAKKAAKQAAEEPAKTSL